MANIRNIGKEGFGKILMPEKIFKLEFKKEMQELYEKVFFDNINYLLITNLFALSIIFSLVTYIFLYPIIFEIFYAYIIKSFTWNIIIIFSSWLVMSLLMYYFILLIFFFITKVNLKKHKWKSKKICPSLLII